MMRRLLILAVLLAPVCLPAQGQSGRHFNRTPRAPVTAAQDPVVEATTSTQRVEPLRRLRSGRSWSLFHFGRRPMTPANGVGAVDASADRGARRTPFWGRKLRHGAR